jgi:hypothetical protein
MIYTLMLGAPVSKEGSEFGSLTRIIVDNGIANQIVVNPSGFFTGPERVVPINAIEESSAEGVTLNSTDVDWHGYNAYNLEQYLGTENVTPDLLLSGVTTVANPELADRPPTELPSDSMIMPMSVVLTSRTRVGDEGHLAGLVTDTGRPTELLLEGGGSIPFEQVGILDEAHITIGPKPERMDDVNEPSSIGQPPEEAQ